MSTTPLTVVEGAMALPRSRPFNDVPAPFGRGWNLLAPTHCFEKGLHGLYGAVLKTFSVTDQPIRSFCRWVAPDPRLAAARAAAAALGARTRVRTPDAVGAREPQTVEIARGAVSSDAVAASASGSPEVSAVPDAFASVKVHVSEAAPRASLVSRWGLAGGACALGGAALLAWMAWVHGGARDQRHDTNSEEAAVAVREGTVSPGRLPDDIGSSKPVSPAAGPQVSSAASAPKLVHAAPVSGFVSHVAEGGVAARARASVEPQAVPTDPRAHTRQPGAEKTDEHRPTLERHLAKATVANHALRVADAAPALAPRTSTKPSAADAYSLHAPSPLVANNAASIDITANTHRAAITSPASSANSSASDGQQWVNRLTNRRVTEAPEQFSK
ncbi:MAG TPA: hypothetical protein VF573_05940 [Paraburkholderia sp.]|uniref:hypothetical protein n=1 Tax=Paraburkholderia sp. TaxID=1926495 RepID=UPI002ED1F43A